jgi:transposase
MSVCVYSVSVLSCVHGRALRRVDPPSKESYRVKKAKKLKKRPRSKKKAVEPWIDSYYITNQSTFRFPTTKNTNMVAHALVKWSKSCDTITDLEQDYEMICSNRSS